MGFPVIEQIKSGTVTSASATWTLDYPDTTEAGEQLIAICVHSAGTGSISGWGASAAGTTARTVIGKKVADGSEGGTTFTATFGSASTGVWAVLRVSNIYASALVLNSVAAAGCVTGSVVADVATANPNPPSLDPVTWAAQDTTWLAWTGVNAEVDVTAVPTNYTSILELAGGGRTLCIASRDLNASSEDPGTFTLASSQTSTTNIIGLLSAEAGPVLCGQSSLGVVTTGTGAAVSVTNCKAGDLVILQCFVDGTTDGPTTGSVTNLEALNGVDGSMTDPSGGQNVGSPLVGRQHLRVGRAIADGTVSLTVATGGDDIYYMLHVFRGVPTAGTTWGAITEGETNAAGTNATVPDSGVTSSAFVPAIALNFVAISDDNDISAFTGQTGGTWFMPGVSQGSATGTDGEISLIVAHLPAAGTINGGTFTQADGGDGYGVYGVALAGNPPAAGGDTYEKAGSGILALVGSGDAIPTVKTGAAVRGLVGAAADAVTFTDTGSGVLVRSGSAADAVTFTETGAAILARSGSGSDAVTFTETGSGVRGHTASATDAVTFTETGAGILARAGSAADAATFTETGIGKLNASGSGVAEKVGGIVAVKAGTGVAELKGAGSDATTFTELGAGTLARVGSGTDAVEFTERGSGILAAVGSGPKEVGGGTTYIKTGLGRIGRILGTTSEKTGAGVLELKGAASDAFTATETGSGTLVRVASGSDAFTATETGQGVLARSGGGVAQKSGAVTKAGSGVRELKGSAADATTFTETGVGIRSHVGSGAKVVGGLIATKAGAGILGTSGYDYIPSGAGIRGHVGSAADAVTFTKTGSATRILIASGSDAAAFTETGAGVRGHVGSASDAATFTETGVGKLNASGSGASVRAGGANKTGAGVRGHSALGADAVAFTETGTGISSRVGSGTDAAAFAETGTGIRGHTGSGAAFRGAAFEKTGTGVSAHTGGGFDAITYTENGSAALVRSASGMDAATFTERGSGVLAAHGSGAKFKLGEFVKFGSATTAIIGSGSSDVSMQLPPSGTVSSSHTGRFSRVRVGRITRAREGGVVT